MTTPTGETREQLTKMPIDPIRFYAFGKEREAPQVGQLGRWPVLLYRYPEHAIAKLLVCRPPEPLIADALPGVCSACRIGQRIAAGTLYLWTTDAVTTARDHLEDLVSAETRRADMWAAQRANAAHAANRDKAIRNRRRAEKALSRLQTGTLDVRRWAQPEGVHDEQSRHHDTP